METKRERKYKRCYTPPKLTVVPQSDVLIS